MKKFSTWLPWVLAVIFALTSLWLWKGQPSTTIADFSGQATIKASPDQFIFRPSYQVSNKDVATASSEVSKIGNKVVDKLLTLGVTRPDIQTQVYNNETYYDKMIYPQPEPTPTGNQATYSLTVTVSDATIAQKVLDYLATTKTVSGVTPESTFSDAKRKSLEDQARIDALKDARTKAISSAEALGAKLGKLVRVSDNQWGYPVPLMGVEDSASGRSAETQPTFTAPYLLTGEQTVNYFVTVQYELKN